MRNECIHYTSNDHDNNSEDLFLYIVGSNVTKTNGTEDCHDVVKRRGVEVFFQT